jgi:DNA repair exonuclease SbcCD ATPase subunit
MDLVIRRDIRQLVHDAQEVRSELDMLEQDHEAWAREREENDLVEVIGYLKRLESDVSMMQADWISMGHRYRENGTRQVLESLHRAFSTLDTLFNDLKKVRTEINEAYIRSADLDQLEIDWSRFRKTVGQIEKHLRDGDRLMKVKNVLPSGKVGENVCFSTTC